MLLPQSSMPWANRPVGALFSHGCAFAIDFCMCSCTPARVSQHIAVDFTTICLFFFRTHVNPSKSYLLGRCTCTNSSQHMPACINTNISDACVPHGVQKQCMKLILAPPHPHSHMLPHMLALCQFNLTGQARPDRMSIVITCYRCMWSGLLLP